VSLGILAGAFGFARLLCNLPAGLLLAHHLRTAILLGAITLTAGNLLLFSGDALWTLVLGRGLYGAGHATRLLSVLITVSRFAAASGHAFSLNVVEFSGMLGMLLGMLIVAAVPEAWPWQRSLMLASAPQLAGLLLLPGLLRGVGHTVAPGPAEPAPGTPGLSELISVNRLTALAWASGFVLAVAWAAVGQFILPLRAAREFELSRIGVAMMLALPQVVDLCFLLPIGRLADRVSRVRLLAVVLLVLSGGIAAMAFGSFAWAVLGCALFGIGLAAWMLPISILGRPASPRAAALRVSLHRTFVDAGVFFGPLGAGLLADAGALWVAGAFSALGLLLVGLALLAYARGEPRAQ
jgi:predicted MFS family arabinose efflux permease